MTSGSTVLPARVARRAAPARLDVRRVWTDVVPVALVLLAVVARLVQWAGGRSLWLDEVFITRSIISRGFVELVTEPLAHRQAAPSLWLWAEWVAVQLFGDGERALRLVPLLSGLATLVLALAVARRVLPAVLVPVAVLFVVVNPVLLYYANEVKQYSSDVTVTLLVVLLALRALPDPEQRLRRVVLLSAAGCVAVWASHTAVLSLAGVSVALVLERLRAAGLSAAVRTAALLSPWLVSLAVAYVQVLAPVRDNSPLINYWAPTFPRGGSDLPAWLVRRVTALTDDPLGLAVPALAAGLLLLGAAALVVRSGWRAAVVVLPLLLGVLAAALSAYPLASRLALWSVPLLAVLLAAAPWVVLRGGWQRPAAVAVGAGLLVTALPAAGAAAPALVQVQHREELGPVLAEVAGRVRPDDLVLPDVATQIALSYYGPRTGVERDGYVQLVPRRWNTSCEDARLLRVFADRRVWVLSSHQNTDIRGQGTRADLLSRLGSVTRVGDLVVREGAQAVLFDPTATGQLPAAANDPRLCLRVELLPGR